MPGLLNARTPECQESRGRHTSPTLELKLRQPPVCNRCIRVHACRRQSFARHTFLKLQQISSHRVLRIYDNVDHRQLPGGSRQFGASGRPTSGGSRPGRAKDNGFSASDDLRCQNGTTQGSKTFSSPAVQCLGCIVHAARPESLLSLNGHLVGDRGTETGWIKLLYIA